MEGFTEFIMPITGRQDLERLRMRKKLPRCEWEICTSNRNKVLRITQMLSLLHLITLMD